MLFVLRLQDGDVEVNDNGGIVTVADLRGAVRTAHPAAEHRRIRLIYQGRAVANDADLQRDVVGSASRERVYLMAAIGDIVPPEELAREEATGIGPVREAPVAEPQGFDRLRAAGLSEDEIAALRAQFGAFYGAAGDEDQTALENEWIDSDATASASRAATVDLLVAFLGAWLGIGVFVVLALRTTTRPQLHQLLLGAMCGMGLRFFLWVLLHQERANMVALWL